MPPIRQLAAIMFTDIVGYSMLMGKDEDFAYGLIKKNRALQKPIIESFNGRWIKELGDGVLASFPSASEAVNAAINIQEACHKAKDFQLRIGIHLGEVIFEDRDVFGDGVNIAARIQNEAGPGAIFISDVVHTNVANKKAFGTRFVKEEKLKNIAQPVRIYQIVKEDGEAVAEEAILPVTEYSIAVLPFVNMSGDPDQEYFSDGISEEIINMLAKIPGLKVTGRTSSFAFKGKNLDLRKIGAQLGVNHILEGSVRKAGNRLRITAQLIKAADGFHLYSDNFDREIGDIFAIQDEIALSLMDIVKLKLFGKKKEAVLKRYTDNLEAYQLFLKGRFFVNKFTPDGFFKAIEFFDAAIAEDPTYAIAYAEKAFCYMNLRDFNWLPSQKAMPLVIEAAQRSVELDEEVSECQLALGRIKLHWDWQIREATQLFKKALSINPNNVQAHIQLGFCLTLLERHDEAREHAKKAESLDPLSMLNIFYATLIYHTIGDFEKSLENGKKLIELEPNVFSGYLWEGTSHRSLNHYQKAVSSLKKAVELNPGPFTLYVLGVAYGLEGERSKAEDIIDKLKQMEGIESAGQNFIGRVYASIGEWETAFQYFERALENREGMILWLKSQTSEYPGFLENPKAQEFFKRIGDLV